MPESDLHIPGRGKKLNSPVKDDGIHYYAPGPVIKEFIKDQSFITGIRGPFGSGKSTGCVIKLIRNMQGQKTAPDGWKYRRTGIIRNTYPELRTTTMKTWHQWVPQHLGRWRDAGPPCHHIIDPVQKINWEVLFVALDRPDDVAKLLSMELSDAWVNEAREIPKVIIDGLTGRVGRYPPVWMGTCSSPQIMLDTNPPDVTSWWFVLAERDISSEKNRQLITSMEEAEEKLREKGVLLAGQQLFRFFAQPSGRGPDAENVQNLRPGYYDTLMAGKDQDFIKVYVDGDYGFVMDGKPVYPEYKDLVHSREFPLVRGLGIRLGFDFGLTPACSFSQRMANGRWLVHDEFVSERLGVVTFAQEVARMLQDKYPGVKVTSARGDPAGDSVTPEEKTCFQILRTAGIQIAAPAPTNDPVRRKEGLKFLLRTLIDGEPGILIHQRCTTLRRGLTGGYHFRRLLVAGEAKYREVPEKNECSHIVEALEYDVVSAGEDRNVTIGSEQMARNRPKTADAEYAIFDHE